MENKKTAVFIASLYALPAIANEVATLATTGLCNLENSRVIQSVISEDPAIFLGGIKQRKADDIYEEFAGHNIDEIVIQARAAGYEVDVLEV